MGDIWKDAGAILVDPIEIPDLKELLENSFDSGATEIGDRVAADP